MRKIRILLIDDEDRIVQLLSESLNDDGHKVTGYSDAVAALEYFWSHHKEYDVVVTDHLMPGLLGSDIVQKIREKMPNFPLILATGNSKDDLLHRLGPNIGQYFSVLQKPFHKKHLIDTILTVLAD